MGVLQAHRHERAVVGAPHPALDDERVGERLQHLAHGGEVPLGADDHGRVVLAHVAPRDEGELVGAGHSADLAGVARVHLLDGVAVGRAQEDEQIVYLFRRVEGDLEVLAHVLDLECEPLVQPLADDQAGGVEGVGEHLVQGQVEGAGGGLVAHEHQEGLRRPLLDLHLRRAGAGAADVAGEGVRYEVLTGAVQLQLPGHFGARLEGVPGQLVDLLVVLAPLVGHDEEHVVAAVADVMIDEEAALPRPLHLLAAEIEDLRVRSRVADVAADVSLDDAHSNHANTSAELGYRISQGSRAVLGGRNL